MHKKGQDYKPALSEVQTYSDRSDCYGVTYYGEEGLGEELNMLSNLEGREEVVAINSFFNQVL